MTEYEKYKLQWMIDHNYSLNDLIKRIQHVWEMLNAEKEKGEVIDVAQAAEIWEDERGFAESEIWVCEDEWDNNENADASDFKTNFESATEMLEEKPYNFTRHKELLCLFCSEQETPFDESTLYEFHFFVERFWLEKYVLRNYNITDLQEWIKEIYTSDESEDVLFDGIKAGVVVGVYK